MRNAQHTHARNSCTLTMKQICIYIYNTWKRPNNSHVKHLHSQANMHVLPSPVFDTVIQLNNVTQLVDWKKQLNLQKKKHLICGGDLNYSHANSKKKRNKWLHLETQPCMKEKQHTMDNLSRSFVPYPFFCNLFLLRDWHVPHPIHICEQTCPKMWRRIHPKYFHIISIKKKWYPFLLWYRWLMQSGQPVEIFKTSTGAHDFHEMGVSLNGGTPNLHPKMIIFSRKNPWLLGKPTILGTPQIAQCPSIQPTHFDHPFPCFGQGTLPTKQATFVERTFARLVFFFTWCLVSTKQRTNGFVG